jgi:hypothetical protein
LVLTYNIIIIINLSKFTAIIYQKKTQLTYSKEKIILEVIHTQ